MAAIRTYQHLHHGLPPSQAELAEALGVCASAVRAYLEALEQKGRLALRPRKARGIEVLTKEVPQR